LLQNSFVKRKAYHLSSVLKPGQNLKRFGQGRAEGDANGARAPGSQGRREPKEWNHKN